MAMNSESPDEELVATCRIAARQLQLALRGHDRDTARLAALRLAALPKFAGTSLDALIDAATLVDRSDAHAVIALEHGFVSWAELLRQSLPLVHCVTMYTPRMSTFLNRWFTAYDEAADSLRAVPGFLLPYRHEYFVTNAGAVRELGLDPDDPDWQRIGFDWIRPLDAEAHLRLCQQRFTQMLACGEELP